MKDRILELLKSENLEDIVLGCIFMLKEYNYEQCVEIIESLDKKRTPTDPYYVIRKEDSFGLCTYMYLEMEDKSEIEKWGKEDYKCKYIEI